MQSKSAHFSLMIVCQMAAVLMLTGLLSGCTGEGFVSQLLQRTIEVVPQQSTQTPQIIVLEATLTPFMPISDASEKGVFTEVAMQQLGIFTQEVVLPTIESTTTQTPSLTPQISATPEIASQTVSPTGTVTSQPTITLTSTPTTRTSTITRTLKPGIPTRTPTKTKTRTPTRTVVRTFTLTPTVQSKTSTVTNTSIPSTSTYTSIPGNTSTFTVAANTNTATVTSEPGTCAYTENSGFESTLIALINEGRIAKGLTALSTNNMLTAAARGHSQDMACQDYFSHTGLDGSTSASRVEAQGYSYSWVGENIYGGSGSYNSPEQAYLYWVGSQAHYDNMMNSNFSEIGIGYVYCADSMYGGYFTANFASP
jgi:uncharacterized protein YkwD